MRKLVGVVVVLVLAFAVFHRPLEAFTGTLHRGLGLAFADPFRSTLWLVHIDIPNYHGCAWRDEYDKFVPPERVLEYGGIDSRGNLRPAYSLAEAIIWLIGLIVCIAFWIVFAVAFWLVVVVFYVWASTRCGFSEACEATWAEFRKGAGI